MPNHSQSFINLYNLYKEIDTYHKGITIDIERVAKLFYLHLVDINIQWHSYNCQVLHEDEYVKVQRYINRITGNRNLSVGIRREILNESMPFNEMVESLRRDYGYGLVK